MKFHREKWFRDRLYEVYFYLGLDGFILAFCIADIDIHLQATILNLRSFSA